MFVFKALMFGAFGLHHTHLTLLFSLCFSVFVLLITFIPTMHPQKLHTQTHTLRVWDTRTEGDSSRSKTAFR